MRAIATAVCLAATLSLVAAPSHAQAPFKGENLLVTMPPGFKMAFKDSRNGMNMQEWVPANETIQNWTEMVTVQVFLRRTDIDPALYLATMQKQWAGACKGSTGTAVTTGKVNGFAASSTLLRCPLLASSGKPETTMFRAIKGNDSFYLVQRAIRATGTPEQLENMKQYLDTVSLCDSRSIASPCPVTK